MLIILLPKNIDPYNSIILSYADVYSTENILVQLPLIEKNSPERAKYLIMISKSTNKKPCKSDIYFLLI